MTNKICPTCKQTIPSERPTQPDIGIVLPGWTCSRCHGFNGEEKEPQKICRACGMAKPAPVHYALTNNEQILNSGTFPEIACNDAFPVQWASSEKHVTCPKCLESIAKKDP